MFVDHPRFAPYEALFDAFERAGFEIVFVGGCVRDLVMGADDIGDIDLATSAEPHEIKRVLTESGFKCFPLGEKFGTITTLVEGVTVEITTYRVGELYEPGSRHPVVKFGTDLRQDLVRRDLSLNAMAMRRDGSVVDPFCGQRAIAERILEVPGGGYENTISILRDDPLRLLRTARFAARFDFPPTEDTTRAAAVSAPDLEHISRERWKVELDKLLVAAHPERGLHWLHETSALAVVLPELRAFAPSDIAPLSDAIRRAPKDPMTRWALVAWAALLGADPSAETPPLDARTALAEALASRFKWSNKERRTLALLLDTPFDAEALARAPSTPTLRRWYDHARDDVFRQLDVARARWPERAKSADARRRELRALLDAEDPVPRLPRGLGNALRKAAELEGPAIGDAMTTVRDAILDGEVANSAPIATYVDYFLARDEGT